MRNLITLFSNGLLAGGVGKLSRINVLERLEIRESIIIKLNNTKLDWGENKFVNYIVEWKGGVSSKRHGCNAMKDRKQPNTHTPTTRCWMIQTKRRIYN